MARPRVFVTRKLPQPALERIAEICDMDLWEGDMPPSRETLLEKVKGCDGILCLLTDRVDAEVMDASDSLRVVSNYAVGFDNIDVPAATSRRIQVGNTPGVLTETTADLAFALLLASARRIVEADRFTRDGKWQTWSPMLLCGRDVHHSQLGIVGFGRIGFEMAKRAQGFDMKVQYTDSTPNEKAEKELGLTRVDLRTLLSTSDFISLHVPLTESTHHMIGAEELSLMKPTAILVNSARGPIVDENALYEALRDKRIAGAGLDVFEVEPASKDNPLFALDNVVVVPHIGSASVDTRLKMALMAAENLIAGVMCKDLPHKVNVDLVGDYRCGGPDS